MLVRRKRNCKREFKAELLLPDVKLRYLSNLCVYGCKASNYIGVFLGFLVTKFKITVSGDLMVALVPFIAEKLTSW